MGTTYTPTLFRVSAEFGERRIKAVEAILEIGLESSEKGAGHAVTEKVPGTLLRYKSTPPTFPARYLAVQLVDPAKKLIIAGASPNSASQRLRHPVRRFPL